MIDCVYHKYFRILKKMDTSKASKCYLAQVQACASKSVAMAKEVEQYIVMGKLMEHIYEDMCDTSKYEI